MTTTAEARPRATIHFDNDDSFQVAAIERGWSDGLPLVPPTAAKVDALLAAAGVEPDDVLGGIATRDVTVTAEATATNAVMAGCRPEHFPVVVAAVSAHLSELGNSHCTTASLGGPSHAVVVNGPIRGELGIAGGPGCFGPGFPANASIGRALRLVIRNVCQSVPGVLDRAVFSSPARYSFCFGEDEEAGAPWTPLHVQLGYAPDESTVTMLSVWGITESNGLGDAPELVLDHLVQDLRFNGFWKQLGDPAADQFLGDAFGFMIVVGEEHRRVIQAAGWTKADVQAYTFERLVAPTRGTRDLVCHVSAPERMLVVAAGGPGIPETQVLMPHLAAPVTTRITRP
ncbi:hypothetical protein [Nocardioides halotolerans]|uniref:hypothetical protein n=1 Tax=Nocardioides halotolerans TaxID=433660 RepID=UPI0003F6DB4C|nr:hypothetical protein [Nocardioides halotolerans]